MTTTIYVGLSIYPLNVTTSKAMEDFDQSVGTNFSSTHNLKTGTGQQFMSDQKIFLPVAVK